MNYNESARLGLERYQKDRDALLLAIESSCDETAASVLRGAREVASMSVYTQIPLHRRFGGVVPELASRSHVEKVGSVVADALEKAGVTLDDISAIAVTSGPGLVGALLVGVSYGKGLAFAKGLPLIGVNHLGGHIAANKDVRLCGLKREAVADVAADGGEGVLFFDKLERVHVAAFGNHADIALDGNMRGQLLLQGAVPVS